MAIKKVRLPDGSDVVIDEWLHWPQFSTVEFAAASNVSLRAFTYVQGQRVPQQGAVAGGARTSTSTDTNQVARARMNHDEAFLAYSITYEHWGLTADEIATTPTATTVAPVPVLSPMNLRRLQRDLVISLFVGAGINKPQFRAPFSWIGQGPGAPAYTSGDGVAAGTAFSYGTAGCPSPKDQRTWQLPVFIQSDRVMYLQLASFPGAIADLTQDVRLRFYLDGLKRRPVA
jgi:hypothetical protein